MATEKLCGVVVGEIGYFNGDCRVCKCTHNKYIIYYKYNEITDPRYTLKC